MHDMTISHWVQEILSALLTMFTGKYQCNSFQYFPWTIPNVFVSRVNYSLGVTCIAGGYERIGWRLLGSKSFFFVSPIFHREETKLAIIIIFNYNYSVYSPHFCWDNYNSNIRIELQVSDPSDLASSLFGISIVGYPTVFHTS